METVKTTKGVTKEIEEKIAGFMAQNEAIDEKKLDDKDDSDEVVFVQLKESSN